MNEVSSVGFDNKAKLNSVKGNVVCFKPQRVSYGSPAEDTFEKLQEKRKKEFKKAKRREDISFYATIGTFGAFAIMAGLAVLSAFGKFNPAGFNINKLNFKNYVKDDTLGDLMTTKTLSTKVSTMLRDIVNSKGIKQEYIDLAGLNKKGFPNACIMLGPSGTGKTQSVKMLAKADGSDLAIITMSKFGNSYLNGNAVSMAEMFDELGKIAKKNPQKKYTILFDEGDALTRKIQNIDAHNEYLGKDRQSFITGLEDILKNRNIRVFLNTNVPLEEIDEAVISRFGRNLEFELPTKDQLYEGLKHHLKDVPGCKLNKRNFLVDDKNVIMSFLDKMVGRKCAFRDLEKITQQAANDYAKAMNEADKALPFNVKYLENALGKIGKTAGEIAAETQAAAEKQRKILDMFGKGS